MLLGPEQREAPLVHLTPMATGRARAPWGCRDRRMRFFGRDEALTGMDRAFDTHQMVLLHAFAGAGKTATAA